MKKITLISFIVFSVIQITKAQIVISKPNLGFTQACASPSFNSYNVTFIFSPESGLNASNQFVLELSDGEGDFSNSIVIFTSASGSITTSPATISFSLPVETSGEAYRVRVKSTAPVASSTSSDPFPAYYKAQDSPFTINNLIGTAVYCSGSSYLLTIDNPGGPLNDSPLNYPGLAYNWYKEITETTSVFVASGESLSVSEPGTYFVETDYGTCTSNSYSNRVEVSEASSGGEELSINSSLGNPYCASDGPTLLSALNAVSYQWYLDGEEISGATSQTYETNESGNYTVSIDLGDCSATASIDLVNTDFTSSVNVSEGEIMLDEDETIYIEVTTTASNPTFEWYLGDILIVGETSNSYEITSQGNYKVVVTQTTGCVSSHEFSFNVMEAFPDVSDIPNIVTPNGDGINDTWVIPQPYVSGTGTQVVIISAQGKVVLDTQEYQNNWPDNNFDFNKVNSVYYYMIKGQGKSKKGSITVIK